MQAPLLPITIAPVLEILNHAGIAVIAASGAVLAAQKRRDLVTFIFFALATGVGGGTVRDLLIAAPVFWTRENLTLALCLAAALGVWATPVRLWTGRALLWCDAVGLAAFATYGSAKALAFGLAPVPALLMGVFTACLGGIIRDMLAGEPSIIMRSELYVTAAALSSGLLVGLTLLGVPSFAAAGLATAAGLMLRGGAILWRWELPTYGRG
ncbi:MAG: trimeric intracellular cation channel family protein [Chakrabartia sp.]